MEEEVVIPDFSEVEQLLNLLPKTLDHFALIAKAAGILLAIYLLYLLINTLLNIRRNKKIKIIERKIDLLLQKNNIQTDKKGRKITNNKKEQEKKKKTP